MGSRMNKNLLIVLGGGFVIALLVAMIVQAGLSSGKSSDVQILVAAKNLTVGTELKPADVKWQEWPEQSVTSAMIVRKDKQKVEDVAKGRLRRDVASGEAISPALLTAGAKGNVLAAALENGFRAVAIKVKAESMVGGFISPGDRVDVIMTYEVKLNDKDNPMIRKQIQKYATETILENVRVLAIDQQSKRDDDKAKVGRTVTLEVNAEGAEKLNLASVMSKEDLTLSLRAMGDNTIKTSRSVTTDAQVSTILREINRMESSHSNPNAGSQGSTGAVVRVYNGENIQGVMVRPDTADMKGM